MPDSVLGELIRATTAPNAALGVDVPPRVALPPEAWTGWTGTPGLRGHRMGEQWSPQFVPTDSSVEQHARGGGGLSASAVDLITDLRLGLILELLPTGLLRARASVTSLSGEPYVLDGLDLAFPGRLAPRRSWTSLAGGPRRGCRNERRSMSALGSGRVATATGRAPSRQDRRSCSANSGCCSHPRSKYRWSSLGRAAS